MKALVLAVVIAGSVAGGVGGGVLATQFLAPQSKDGVARARGAEVTEAHDYSGEIAQQDKVIRDLSSKLTALNARLEDAEKRADSTKALSDKVKELEATLAKVESRAPAQPAAAGTDANGGGAVEAGSLPPASAIDEAVNRVLEEREAKRAAERQAQREKEMADMTARRNASMLDAMDKRLTLEPYQKEKIAKLLDEQSVKFRDVMAKGMKARETGEEFDWQKEMGTVSQEALAAVRAELTPAQQTIFDEATKENGLEAFGGGRRGMGPGGNPGGNPGGRGGRGGN